jgi:hypothetical protein
VRVLLAFAAPGNDEEISELPWRQAETKLATLIAQFVLPSSTGRAATAGSSVRLDRWPTGCRHTAHSRHGSWLAVHQH